VAVFVADSIDRPSELHFHMITRFPSLLPLVVVGACLPLQALAHALWLEKNEAGRLQLSFGEYEAGLREPAEKIEKMGPIRIEARSAGRNTPVDLKPSPTGLVSEKEASVDAVYLFHADKGGVRDLSKHGLGIARSLSYGRFLGATWPSLKADFPLDIIPLGGLGRQVLVEFQGKPLPKAKLEIVAPNGWMREIKTNENGVAELPAPWPGLYVVTTSTQDKTPGEYDGKKYDNVSYRMTLTFAIP
jgi:hypothetical protein